MDAYLFQNREDAARKLADRLRSLELREPIVLGIPRGGMVTASVLARELGADLDVVLARKLRAPGQPELAIGAVSEDGAVSLNPQARSMGVREDYLEQERQQRLAEVARRRQLFRGVRPKEPLTGRSVIVTDDGIATGSTMIAALRAVRQEGPQQVIAAVPVAPADRLDEVRREADHVVCLETPEMFMAIGQFYADFEQVDDETVTALLREFVPAARRTAE